MPVSKSRKSSYSPYSDKPSESQNTSLYSVKKSLLDLKEQLPAHATKKNIINKLHRLGYEPLQMSDEDAQCAARFPIFSSMPKDLVLNMAESLGVNTDGMSKIDGCHALHEMGVKTEKHVDKLMMLKSKSMPKYISKIPSDWNPLATIKKKPPMSAAKIASINEAAEFDILFPTIIKHAKPMSSMPSEWQCENPTISPVKGSCRLSSKGGKVAPGFAGRVYSNEMSCNNKCVKGDMGSMKANDFINRLQHKQDMDEFTYDKLGSKCKRSIVNHRVKMRNSKGRFCKNKKSKKSKKSTRRSMRK